MEIVEFNGSLVAVLDAAEALDWVTGASCAQIEVERLAVQKNRPIAVRAEIGASLGIIWPDGRESNLADDRVKEQVRQQFKVEEQLHEQ